jgi:hypothetical protein
MSFSRPIQWYHSHADPICPDGTFKGIELLTNEKRAEVKVVAFDRSLFRLFTLKFSNKSVQRTLFLSFEINNCFQIIRVGLRHTFPIIHLTETTKYFLYILPDI